MCAFSSVLSLPPFVSYFVVFCHRLRRGNLARIIIYACIILFMSMSTTIYYAYTLHIHTYPHTLCSLSNVVLVDILFLNLPFCIYFDLMLPSMSFQCTVYIRVENFNAIHISKYSQQIAWCSIILSAELFQSFCFSFSPVRFFYVIHEYTEHVYIKIELWATDIGIKCSFHIFANQLWVCDALNICTYLQIYLFIVSLCLCVYVPSFAGEFNMKIASIHKLQMKWSTMLKQFLSPNAHRVLVFAFHHFN